MRRREYLRSALGAGALSGMTATVLGAATGTDASPSSTAPTATATVTPTATPTPTETGTAAPTETDSGDGFGPLGSAEITNSMSTYLRATEAVTTVDGQYAFVSRFDGFEVVDLSDPASPEVVHTATNLLVDEGEDPLIAVLDVKYNRERLLVSAGFTVGFPGFALYDVSTPTDPTLLRTYETLHNVHNSYLYGNHAYLTDRGKVEIIDLRPAEPERVATWSVTDYDDGYEAVSVGLRNVHDLYVQGDRCYLACWDAGTWILDVSDPAEPTHVGHVADRSLSELQSTSTADRDSAVLEPPGNDHYVQPNDDGTVLAVGKESWNDPDNDAQADDPGGPSGITLWDVADPSDPTELATVDPPPVPGGETTDREGGYYTTAHNFDIVGDTLYSSWYRGGVRVHDISDPADPLEVAAWEQGDKTSFWTAQAAVLGEYFVASSMHDPEDEGANGPGGLYTFPDPLATDATRTPAGPPVDSAPPATESPTPTVSPTPTPSPTAAATPTESQTPATGTTADGTGGTTGGDGPGLGVLAALAGLGLGTWRAVRSGDEP
jgi:hypothetical protein